MVGFLGSGGDTGLTLTPRSGGLRPECQGARLQRTKARSGRRGFRRAAVPGQHRAFSSRHEFAPSLSGGQEPPMRCGRATGPELASCTSSFWASGHPWLVATPPGARPCHREAVFPLLCVDLGPRYILTDYLLGDTTIQLSLGLSLGDTTQPFRLAVRHSQGN